VIMVSWNIFEAIVGPREDWESNFGPRHIWGRFGEREANILHVFVWVTQMAKGDLCI
jgi:hypothetical protein